MDVGVLLEALEVVVLMEEVVEVVVGDYCLCMHVNLT
jgi:hypothetical protein